MAELHVLDLSVIYFPDENNLAGRLSHFDQIILLADASWICPNVLSQALAYHLVLGPLALMA